MIYAKCVSRKHTTTDIEDFKKRQSKGEHVYCIGQTTKSKNGLDLLYCVPLNFILDCLKYGDLIAIIEINNGESNYISKSSYMGLEICSSEQRVINILDLNDEKTIDFIFNEVGNPDLVHIGYISYLPENIQNRIKKWQYREIVCTHTSNYFEK